MSLQHRPCKIIFFCLKKKKKNPLTSCSTFLHGLPPLLILQVRDVLKGTLPANTIFNSEEIHIQDNHYVEDPVPMLMTPESTKPASTPSQESPGRLPYQTAEVLGGQFYVSSAEVSDADTSPEHGDGETMVETSKVPPTGHAETTGKKASSSRKAAQGVNIPKKPEIEMRSFHQMENVAASSPDRACGSPKSYADHWPTMMTNSRQETRTLGRSDSGGSDVYDSNQNTRRQKLGSTPRKSSVDNADKGSGGFGFARSFLRGYRNWSPSMFFALAVFPSCVHWQCNLLWSCSRKV